MEFCLVIKVRNHSPEIAGKKRKEHVWGAGLPSLPLVSWATRSVHLPLIVHGAETWIVLTLTGGGHYKKDTKNIKEIDHSSFERLKLGHNSAFFSISSFECKTGANVPAGSCGKETLAGERQQIMHHEATRGFKERETCFLWPPVLPVFWHYPRHMPFNLTVPHLLHLESQEH